MSQVVCSKPYGEEKEVDELVFVFSVVETLLPGVELTDRQVAHLFVQNAAVWDKINTFLDGMEKVKELDLDGYSAFLGMVAGALPTNNKTAYR